MEWLDTLQRDLGAPVVAFALEYWFILAIVGALGVWWLLGGSFGTRTIADGEIVFGDSDPNDGGGGDGGD